MPFKAKGLAAGRGLKNDPVPTALLGDDGDVTPEAATITELDNTGDLGKKGVVLATTDVVARLQASAALAHNDAAAGNQLSAEGLYAEALRVGIAPVSRTAYTFFTCHDL